MGTTIDDVAGLEACIGKTPAAIHLKVIDHLDDGAQRWIAASPFFFAAFGDAGTIGITPGGGETGFARSDGPQQLCMPATALDESQLATPGHGFGALFLVPGLGETLRVNGRVASIDGGVIRIAVEECYVHCAKALIRSDFWNAAPRGDAPDDAASFLAASRFMALATIDNQGRADVSPKGDPPGALIRLQDGVARCADRPGNRRADSFRNILVQPRIAAAVLIPGAAQVAIVAGTARLSTDAVLLASFTVNGKTPLLATCIDGPQLAVRPSAALRRARLWPAAPHPDGINPAAMFAAHVRLNKTRGVQATLLRAAVSVPGLMQRGLERDYKTNLY
jgi:predicted pyridoxine 5'-phosphate oxidase superfamily flavin-nucleotide-binding protein